tara:strand:+ start:1040 stop:2311 length:1272 start_codon:yes stop_codon:yes gene_type:complete
MIIVETNKEKQKFLDYWNNEQSTIIPIWEDLERHPINNKVSFLYIAFSQEDFILPFNHNDCEKLEIDLSTSNQIKYCWNKKGLLQANLNINNLKDVQSSLFFNKNELYPFYEKIEVLTNFYHRLGIRDDLGKTISIMKFIEVLKGVKDDFGTLEPCLPWIDDTMIPILSEIEQIGLRVDREKFIDRWPNQYKHIYNHPQGDVVYTEYNPYTITSRPSNRHGGVNFSALNKKDGSRECFIPPQGTLFLQFDYDAFHVRLIGKMINYDLPKTSVHQWLADQYGVEYDESKGRTFRILYGGVSDEDRKIPFFDKVDKYINKIQIDSVNNGYIQTPKGRKIPLGWIEKPNSQKLFNYLLQATETEHNIEVMDKLKKEGLPLPILYTYDSFLFEFDDSEVGTIKKVKSVLESFGFPTKVDWGSDYSKV